MCRDFWSNGSEEKWFELPRIETTSTHGTGCVLSAAVSSFVALGETIPSAIQKSKEILTQKLRVAEKIGAGFGPFI